MDTMNLQVAIIAHLNWKSKLSDFFYGIEDLKQSDVPDHTTCDFGKWLYSTGLDECKDVPEVDVLEKLHKEVHADINRLLAMPKDVRLSDEGKKALADFKEKCDTMVSMLERMKTHMEQNKTS